MSINSKPNLRKALQDLLLALADDRSRQRLYKDEIEAAYKALGVDPGIIVWLSEDGSIIEPHIYADLDYPIILVQTNGDPEIVQCVETVETEPLSEALGEDEVKLDNEGTIAAKGNLRVVSTFHDYQIELLTEWGDVVESRGMGDGTGYQDCNMETILAGTLAHQLAVQNDLEHNYASLLEAYFPDAETLLADWKAKHNHEAPF